MFLTECRSPALVHISELRLPRRFTAHLENLVMNVDAMPDHWRLQVHESGDDRILYAGQRSSAGLAKSAAAEFALFHVGPGRAMNPEELAKKLPWETR